MSVVRCETRIQFTYILLMLMAFRIMFLIWVRFWFVQNNFFLIRCIYQSGVCRLIKIQLKLLFFLSTSRLITLIQSKENPLTAKGYGCPNKAENYFVICERRRRQRQQQRLMGRNQSTFTHLERLDYLVACATDRYFFFFNSSNLIFANTFEIKPVRYFHWI